MPSSTRPNASSIRRHVLPNGIITLIYQNPNARTVLVDGAVWAGAIDVQPEQMGLANFVASSLMRGTQQRSFEQIYDELEGVGASLGFSSGQQLSDFSAESLPEDLDLLLKLVNDTLRNPAFPSAEIEKVRSETLTSIQMQQNNSGSMARKLFRETLYGQHPYGLSTSGTMETVSSFTPDDLAAFHQAHYAPNNMILAVVSALDPQLIRNKLEQVFGNWHNPNYSAQPKLQGQSRPAGIQRVHHAMPDKTQSDIVMGLTGPLRSNPNYNAIRMANTILGVFGMMGRLGKSVREKQGLAYYVRSVLSGSWGPSPWYVNTGVAPDKVEQAIESIQLEIRRIQNEPVSAEELSDSKAYLTGSLPMSIETSAGIVGNIFQMEFLQLGLDYLDQYQSIIEDVTIEQVQAAAQTHFSADDLVIAVAGP